MDPKVCLEIARQAIKDGDLSAAEDALRDYAEWCSLGGFHADALDKRYERLSHQVRRLQDASIALGF